jgi:hypothetical protein
MRQIAFLSQDPVQEAYAREIASDYGVDLQVWFPRDPSRIGEYAAVICDLDCWPTDGQDQWLSELKAARPSCPVAVFSYQLNAKRATALRRQGIAVFRRLSPAVFSDLRR